MSTTDDNDDQCGGVSGEITSIKKECTSCEQNNVDNITEGIDSIVVLCDKSTCANCGKEGNSSDMNTCNKCNMVKYCNAACKKKHRTKHKKKCDRRVAELYDEQLFKEVEPEECPICLLPLPVHEALTITESCCGKRICIGCIVAMKMSEGDKDMCPFCRTPQDTTKKEEIERIQKLMDKGNAMAFTILGGCYISRELGLPQDYQKANDLYQKGGELGCAEAYYNLGISYYHGRGVERDVKKAQHYYELATMGGHVVARYKLGCIEGQAGNHYRALNHMIIAARAGDDNSLDIVKQVFTQGGITKDGYADILRAYHKRQKEMRSEERDKAVSLLRR